MSPDSSYNTVIATSQLFQVDLREKTHFKAFLREFFPTFSEYTLIGLLRALGFRKEDSNWHKIRSLIQMKHLERVLSGRASFRTMVRLPPESKINHLHVEPGVNGHLYVNDSIHQNLSIFMKGLNIDL